MEHRPGDAAGAAWFLPGFLGPGPAEDAEPAEPEDGTAEPEDGTAPHVLIAVSLDELDGMTGDLLV